MGTNFIKQLQRLRRFDRLTRLKATGTPQEFARKLEVSESTLHNTIKLLREDFEIPIAYCTQRESYFYEKEGKMEIAVGFRPLRHDELVNSNAGSTKSEVTKIDFLQ